MWSNRTSEFLKTVSEKLAAFGRSNVEALIKPALEIREGKNPHMIDTTGRIINIEDDDTNQDTTMEEKDDSTENATISRSKKQLPGPTPIKQSTGPVKTMSDV